MASHDAHAATAAAGPAKPGPIDDKDVQDWVNRANTVFKAPGDVVKSKSPEGSDAWYSGLFGCFNPLDTCLVTYFLPCVTFGKTHHRLRKNGNLEGFEPVNTSVCGIQWREKFFSLSFFFLRR
jgi:hypothetical protein